MTNVRRIVLCAILASFLAPSAFLMPTAAYAQPTQPNWMFDTPEAQARQKQAEKAHQQEQQRQIAFLVCIVGAIIFAAGIIAYAIQQSNKNKKE